MWRMQIELEFPVEVKDIEERYTGDTEVDFSTRALERVRVHLETLLANSSFVHYHLISVPKRIGG